MGTPAYVAGDSATNNMRRRPLWATTTHQENPMDYSYSYQTDSPVPGIISAVILVIGLIALWRTFSKAGRPGWFAIIPILNIYTLVKISGNAGWWTILWFIPLVNIVIALLVSLGVAKNFGKSGVFGFFGLFLFSFIGYLILGFGGAQYTGERPAA
jgi:hypothetical protein